MSFQFGPLTIQFYGIIIMLGAVAGAFLAQFNARRRGENPDLVWDGLIWVLIGGIIGARLWHILTPPPSMVERGITTAHYLTHPLETLAIWNGGLGIPGAVIGGAIALFAFSKRRNISFLSWVDIAAPALALGQAIGRWGNFVNQELYGAPTDLPWAIFIGPHHRLPGYMEQATYHPLFLYESLWNLANVFFLLWLGWRFADRLRAGGIFLAYLVIYPIGRFLLEFLRLDSSQVAGLNINQTIMAVVALAALSILLIRRREKPL
ncbi:MAG: prolipoprotein diacylglyceryl transferase [Anaerolineales bacterium]|nr:MAG: prolipoprotein diacylglyceryl transferase [Anaerolineales bacterium]